MRALIVLIIVAVAGYYIYQSTFGGGGGEAPSCKQIYESCRMKCRQTETETEPYNACLKKCQGALDACT